MSEPKVAVLPVESIKVRDGVNPRRRFDQDAIDALAASVQTTGGLIQSLAVEPDKEGGGYFLVAGERRLRAIRQAGIEKVPAVVISAENARVAALAENVFRVDLNEIEIGFAIQAIAATEGLRTHEEIGHRIDRSTAYVSAHLRLLRLPEGVQAHIAAGHVPMAAERNLRRLAAVSTRIAECACELVERGDLDAHDLIKSLDQVLYVVAAAKFSNPPTMINARFGDSLSRIVTDQEKYAELAERYRAINRHEEGAEPHIGFTSEEIDAARAAGCLLEHDREPGGFHQPITFITDAAFAADLAERAIERMERRAAEEARRQAERAGVELVEDGDADPAELVKEARRAEREQRKKDAEKARRKNLAVGRALLERRGAKSRKDHSLARARVVAEIVLENNPTLAARGLRLALPQLQEVEVKPLKSGEAREKVTYRDPEECQSYLRERIAEARTANEVFELLGDAFVAAELTDEAELPVSRRVHGALRGWTLDVGRHLKADIKAVRLAARRG
jgi:ParB/RepB/Spo0J family partition protein